MTALVANSNKATPSFNRTDVTMPVPNWAPGSVRWAAGTVGFERFGGSIDFAAATVSGGGGYATAWFNFSSGTCEVSGGDCGLRVETGTVCGEGGGSGGGGRRSAAGGASTGGRRV